MISVKENKTVILLASSRSFGNTRNIVEELISIKPNLNIIDLNNYNISYYDYEFRNTNDDFLSLVNEILQYDTIIFATPIYWYTMSAQLKTFFDRLSDLLHPLHMSLGRQLRGKKMAVVSCGSDEELMNGFAMPFVESAKYLGMQYVSHVHCWVEKDNTISNANKESLVQFSKLI